MHCIVPTHPPLYSRCQISVNLMLVLYRPSVGPVRSFTLIVIIEMYRFLTYVHVHSSNCILYQNFIQKDF